MPEPLTRFNHGDPASKALNASFLNSIIDRLNRLDKSNRHKPSINTDNATLYCDAVNNTSLDFAEFSILTPYRPGVTIATADELSNFQADPLLDVITPTATTEFPVIAVESIRKNGGIGRVAIGGVAVCTVNITNTGHEYATTTASDNTRMTSAATGPVRILWKASAGTGNKSCMVVLLSDAGGGGGASTPSDFLAAKLGSSSTYVSISCPASTRIIGTCTATLTVMSSFTPLSFVSGYLTTTMTSGTNNLTNNTGSVIGYQTIQNEPFLNQFESNSTIAFDYTNTDAVNPQLLKIGFVNLSGGGHVMSISSAQALYRFI